MEEEQGLKLHLFVLCKFSGQPDIYLSNLIVLSLTQSRLGLVEEGEEALVGGSLHLLDHLAALEDLEGGHALDAGSLRDVARLVDVALLHHELGEVGNVALVDRTDPLAWRAPRSSEIDDKGLIASLKGFELFEVLDVEVSVVSHCRVRFEKIF